MGVIYYRWTATCLLEFQAAYHRPDLPRSIFTFGLGLNRHDKHTRRPRPRCIFIAASDEPDGLDLMHELLTRWQKVLSQRERKYERERERRW